LTPLLPLDTWRSILGYNPYHFWGLSNADVPVTSNCNAVVKEYDWQNAQAVGRADIREAIESAENLLASYLGYNPAPKYTEVTLPWPRYFDNSRTRFAPTDATGRWIAPRIPDSGYVQALGVEALTLIGTATKSTPAVGGDTLIFTDADGDGLADTFTITLPTSQTDPDKVAVYFVAADRLDSEPVGARWRIEPVAVSIAAGVATIIGRIWTIVRPIKYQGVNPAALDPGNLDATTGPYAQSLAVYTRTTDPNGLTITDSQAVLVWETSPCHGWWCGCGCQNATVNPAGAVSDPAAIASAVARGTIRDSRLGLVGIGEAVYNATSGIWSTMPWGNCAGEPDSLTVRVLSGYPLDATNQMSAAYKTAVARLAMAELGRPVCACDTANRELYRWQKDLAQSSGANEEAYGFATREILNAPFGSRRGAIFAWGEVRNKRITPVVIGF
jgi:hypothetical protein